jgi:thiol-disulfide isomerase/thioredoxin
MAKTPSTMLALGTKAPHFKLKDVVHGELISIDDSTQAKATVVMFICNHCPYVKHVNPELVLLAEDYNQKDVRFIAINSNDVKTYPDDSPLNMKQVATELNYPFPYLFDETQEVAQAYQAACTPDFFVFNHTNDLVYRGQLDDSRPGNGIELSGHSIRLALDSILHDKPVPSDQRPSIGCNIKWKK